jgi:hypothetical protein
VGWGGQEKLQGLLRCTEDVLRSTDVCGVVRITMKGEHMGGSAGVYWGGGEAVCALLCVLSV